MEIDPNLVNAAVTGHGMCLTTTSCMSSSSAGAALLLMQVCQSRTWHLCNRAKHDIFAAIFVFNQDVPEILVFVLRNMTGL